MANVTKPIVLDETMQTLISVISNKCIQGPKGDKGERGDYFDIKTTMDDIAIADTVYFLGEKNSVSVTLPSNSEIGDCISVCWYNGTTPATFVIQGTMLDFSYTPSANTRSEINALYDGTYWSVIVDEQKVLSDE